MTHILYKMFWLDSICNYITRRPKTECKLNFCDDVHVASFKKFHKQPIIAIYYLLFVHLDLLLRIGLLGA